MSIGPNLNWIKSKIKKVRIEIIVLFIISLKEKFLSVYFLLLLLCYCFQAVGVMTGT